MSAKLNMLFAAIKTILIFALLAENNCARCNKTSEFTSNTIKKPNLKEGSSGFGLKRDILSLGFHGFPISISNRKDVSLLENEKDLRLVASKYAKFNATARKEILERNRRSQPEMCPRDFHQISNNICARLTNYMDWTGATTDCLRRGGSISLFSFLSHPSLEDLLHTVTNNHTAVWLEVRRESSYGPLLHMFPREYDKYGTYIEYDKEKADFGGNYYDEKKQCLAYSGSQSVRKLVLKECSQHLPAICIMRQSESQSNVTERLTAKITLHRENETHLLVEVEQPKALLQVDSSPPVYCFTDSRGPANRRVTPKKLRATTSTHMYSLEAYGQGYYWCQGFLKGSYSVIESHKHLICSVALEEAKLAVEVYRKRKCNYYRDCDPTYSARYYRSSFVLNSNYCANAGVIVKGVVNRTSEVTTYLAHAKMLETEQCISAGKVKELKDRDSNIIDVQFKDTACPEELFDGVYWPRTCPGSVAVPKHVNVDPRKWPWTRTCSGNFNKGTRWSPPTRVSQVTVHLHETCLSELDYRVNSSANKLASPFDVTINDFESVIWDYFAEHCTGKSFLPLVINMFDEFISKAISRTPTVTSSVSSVRKLHDILRKIGIQNLPTSSNNVDTNHVSVALQKQDYISILEITNPISRDVELVVETNESLYAVLLAYKNLHNIFIPGNNEVVGSHLHLRSYIADIVSLSIGQCFDNCRTNISFRVQKKEVGVAPRKSKYLCMNWSEYNSTHGQWVDTGCNFTNCNPLCKCECTNIINIANTVNLVALFSSESEYTQDEITKIPSLETLSHTNVTSSNAQDILRNVSILIHHYADQLDQSDKSDVFLLAAKVISNMVNVSHTLNYTIIPDLLNVVNDTIGASKANVFKPHERNVTGIMLSSFEEILKQLTINDSIKANTTHVGLIIVERNVSVANSTFKFGVSGVLPEDIVEREVEEAKFDTLIEVFRDFKCDFVQDKATSRIVLAVLDDTSIFPDYCSSVWHGKVVNVVQKGDNLCNHNVRLRFRHKKTDIQPGEMKCAFWNFASLNGKGSWDSEGCTFSLFGDYFTCECNHFTNFALLVSPNPETDNDLVLEVMSIVGCSLSLLGFLGIVYTAITHHSWTKNVANFIVLNIAVSECANIIMFILFSYTDKGNTLSLCILSGVILHYFVLTSYCWTLLFALRVYCKIARTMMHLSDTPNYMFKMCAIGWTLPMLLVSLPILDPHCYKKHNNFFCYPSGVWFYCTVIAPVAFVTAVNLFVFVSVRREIRESNIRSRKYIIFEKASSDIVVGIKLFFYLGLPWIFAVLSAIPPFKTFSAYAFCITATPQIFILFLTFVDFRKTYWWKRISLCNKQLFHEGNSNRTYTSSRKIHSSNPLLTSSITDDSLNGSNTMMFSMESYVGDASIRDIPPFLSSHPNFQQDKTHLVKWKSILLQMKCSKMFKERKKRLDSEEYFDLSNIE